MAEFSLEVAIAPDAAVARVKSAINLPKKRMFGVLKTRPEYVGVIEGRSFEIWERQQRAIHAFGQVTGIRGGGRIDVRLFTPPRTRILLGAFFALYLIGGLGITSSGPDGLSASDVVLVIVAATFVGAVFWLTAARQRALLRGFIEELFAETPRVERS